MAANRLESVKAPEDTAKNGHDKKEAAAPPQSGGGKLWIPLIANIVLMPVIAYALTTFVILPKLGGKPAAEAESGGSEQEEGHGGGKTGGKAAKVTAPLSQKVLVNVSGTAGTRYLVASITLVGRKNDLKSLVEHNDAELRDTAASILSGKTISDLEKPGMRNIIRAELISAFNDIIGKDMVNEIFLTEFAVQ